MLGRLENGQLKEVRVDENGRLLVAGSGGTGAAATESLGANASATLQNAAVAVGNGSSVALNGMSSGNISVTGTFVGTVTFEAQNANGDWIPVLLQEAGSTRLSSTTTTTGTWRLPIGGYNALRARVSAYTSGSITVKAFVENTAHTPAVQNVGMYEKLDAVNDAITAYPLGHSVRMVAADTLIKTGAGVLHTITFTCNDAAPTAGSVIFYDNTAESGTVLLNHTFTTTPFVPTTVTLDAAFATGLYVGFTTTNDVNVTVSWR